MATAFLLPLPACGERVGVRGSFRTYRARGDGGGGGGGGGGGRAAPPAGRPPAGGGGGGGGGPPLSARTEPAETPPHPTRFARRPLPASGER
jgi:hypothetical protein